jgi:hypothetical protein
MNDKIAENNFLLSIMADLKSYPEHNSEELNYTIQLIKHRGSQLVGTLLGNKKTKEN